MAENIGQALLVEKEKIEALARLEVSQELVALEGQIALEIGQQAGGRTLFKQGHEYIDMSKIGVPATFPKEWLESDPKMVQKKYFEPQL